ncbi:MAG: hypothetical protein U0802_25825 [Candidatus Binatia bacterium]
MSGVPWSAGGSPAPAADGAPSLIACARGQRIVAARRADGGVVFAEVRGRRIRPSAAKSWNACWSCLPPRGGVDGEVFKVNGAGLLGPFFAVPRSHATLRRRGGSSPASPRRRRALRRCSLRALVIPPRWRWRNASFSRPALDATSSPAAPRTCQAGACCTATRAADTCFGTMRIVRAERGLIRRLPEPARRLFVGFFPAVALALPTSSDSMPALTLRATRHSPRPPPALPAAAAAVDTTGPAGLAGGALGRCPARGRRWRRCLVPCHCTMVCLICFAGAARR